MLVITNKTLTHSTNLNKTKSKISRESIKTSYAHQK